MFVKIKKCAAVIVLTAVMTISLNGCGAVVEMAAVPATVGIIDSATAASLMSNAAAIDNACKNYYSGILSGMINSQSYTTSANKLPDVSADTSVKKQAADSATVSDALQYAGYSDIIDKVPSMIYFLKNTGTYGKGKILYSGDDKIKNMTNGVDYKQLNLNTTLGELYN